MAEGIPHWDDDPDAWDTLVLGTNVMPGVWDVEDGNAKRVIEVKKAPGRDGARIKDQGYENGSMRFVGQLQSREDWEKLQTVWSGLRLTQKGKERTPIAASHPKLQLMQIDRVYITELVSPDIDNGIMTCSISAIEYTDDPKKTKKTKPPPASDGLAHEFIDADFNAVTAGQNLKADEARAQQEKAQSEALAKQEDGEWPNFKTTSPKWAARPDS